LTPIVVEYPAAVISRLKADRRIVPIKRYQYLCEAIFHLWN
jgi:hypothetical protein